MGMPTCVVGIVEDLDAVLDAPVGAAPETRMIASMSIEP
jgi:hypothetical protein